MRFKNLFKGRRYKIEKEIKALNYRKNIIDLACGIENSDCGDNRICEYLRLRSQSYKLKIENKEAEYAKIKGKSILHATG